MKAVPPPYPTLFRIALMAAIAVGALVSFGAAQGVGLAAMSGSTPSSSLTDSGPSWLPDDSPHATAIKASQQAAVRAAVEAIASMGTSRVLILIGLSATASMVLLAALFIRWSVAAPRAAIGRLLGRAAIGAGIFRTLDGAQELVVSRRAAQAGAEVLLAANVPDITASPMLLIASLMSVVWTVCVVGLFLVLSSYFRSEGVQRLLAAHSSAEPDEPDDPDE